MGFILPLALVAIGGILVIAYRDYPQNPGAGLAITTFGSVVVTTGFFLLVFTSFGVYGIMILVPVGVVLSMVVWKRTGHRPLMGGLLVLLINGWSIFVLILFLWGSTTGREVPSATDMSSREFTEGSQVLDELGCSEGVGMTDLFPPGQSPEEALQTIGPEVERLVDVELARLVPAGDGVWLLADSSDAVWGAAEHGHILVCYPGPGTG